ncbi:MAG: lipid-A-disaccharide synthase [Helicobacteraceae bacterium]|jgi:lipid-A-disaccharide synthase|nr:lipid-A-disaccharide synthase [Helicobacteraceae bacterium]
MKLLISALEPSANTHLRPIFARIGEVDRVGIFNGEFGTPIVESKEFGAMGFIEAAGKIPLARRTLKSMVEAAKSCDLALLIDSPAFNIPLAKALKKAYPDLKILYYVLPQVWAWKAKRIAIVESVTDVQAAILPFEKSWWQNCSYVGHPLMEEIERFKESVTNDEIYAFLPGSREGEIKRLFPIFKEAAKRLGGEKLLAIPSHFDSQKISELYGDLEGFSIAPNAHEALLKAKFAFVCSGTATLETALIGTPFVLAYRAKPIDFAIAKRFVKLPFVGLSNLIFHYEKRPPIHSELLQNECNADRLLQCAKEANPQEFLTRSIELRHLLSGRETHIADLIRRLAMSSKS